MDGAGRGGHLLDEVAQVQRTADLVEEALASQRLDGGDRVDGLTVREQRAKRRVDPAVRGPVEVVGLEDLDDVGHRVGREHHRAEHGLLGLEVLGRHAVPAGEVDDVFSRACHP